MGCWGEDSDPLRLEVSRHRIEAGPKPGLSVFGRHDYPCGQTVLEYDPLNGPTLFENSILTRAGKLQGLDHGSKGFPDCPFPGFLG